MPHDMWRSRSTILCFKDEVKLRRDKLSSMRPKHGDLWVFKAFKQILNDLLLVNTE